MQHHCRHAANGDVDRGVHVQAGEHAVALAATGCCGAADKDGRAACAGRALVVVNDRQPAGSRARQLLPGG